jgi:hypothetical protein
MGIGEEPAISSRSCAVRNARSGWVVYSPPRQSGSLRMASMAIARQTRLRPTIATG